MFNSNNRENKIINYNNSAIEVYPLSDNHDCYVQISNNISEVESIWNKITTKENLFLQSTYLKTLEAFPPEKMSFKYLIFYKNNKPFGISYNQIFRLKIEDSLQENVWNAEDKQSFCIISAISDAVKKWFIKRADFNLLICGNMLLTGEFGFHFIDSIDTTQAAALVQDSLETLQEVLDKEQTKISIHLIKDYKVETSESLKAELQKDTYHPFLMQPSMYMNIRPNWTTFEEYLSDMSSKYRVRAKRARKKGKEIIKRDKKQSKNKS